MNILLSAASDFVVTEELISHLLNGAMSLGKKLIIAIILWIIGKKLIRLLEKMVTKGFGKTTIDISVQKFLTSLLRVLAYAVLVITIVGVLGVETTSLVTVIGSLALTVGLSLQGSLSNFAGGVLILIFRPFSVGDYIVACGEEGTVQTIDLFYTKLLTVDNKQITIPNGSLANSNVVNVGKEPVRRLDINVSISYDADVKQAKSLLTQVLTDNSMVLKDKAVDVFVNSLDESCVTIQTRCWTNTADYWALKWELLENYKAVLDANHIGIPYNQLDVHIHN